MIRIALVEDDASYRQELKAYLEQYARENGEEIDVKTFADGDEIAQDYRAEYDIIFMDILMRFMNGMQAAREIRKKDEEVIIIFVTNTAQYAISGYEVNALDYVLKPINYYAFSKTMERALAKVKRDEEKFIVISNKYSAYKVNENAIQYVEINGHSLIYHTRDGDFGAVGTMKEVEEELSGEHFFRCNKCFLVNLKYVDAIEGDDALVAGKPVQISRSRKKPFMEALNAYMSRRA
ncbi:MAG: LytTR family DNA-binding domain-containing protein [Clostridia bacterium]|nr:LytTR family DNA-binding domain-containing protein [Clostridia bacterium]